MKHFTSHTLFLLIATLFVLSVASITLAGSVEVTSSGIFRGSMRHTVALEPTESEPTLVSGVRAGDVISVSLPTTDNLQGYESRYFYLRSVLYETVTYDFNPEKFQKLEPQDSVELDFDEDGEADVRLTLMSVTNRLATFELELIAGAEPESVVTTTETVEENEESETVAVIDESASQDVEPQEDEVVVPRLPSEDSPSIFARFIAWIKNLFI